MSLIWLVQRTKREDSTAQRILYAAEELGFKASLEDHIPFNDANFDFLPKDTPVVFHGGISCVKSVQKRNLSLYPFAWFNQYSLSCCCYYVYWKDYILQNPYEFYTLEEMKECKEDIYKKFGEDDCIFVRPNSNDKIFVGGIVPKERFDSYMNWDWLHDNSPSSLAVVAKPVDIDKEWRLFISENKVIAGSQYQEKRCISLDAKFPQDIIEFAEKVASVWSPHPFYCLDIASTAKGYKVVECGSANCAGFYHADVREIVKEMSRVAIKCYETRIF